MSFLIKKLLSTYEDNYSVKALHQHFQYYFELVYK